MIDSCAQSADDIRLAYIEAVKESIKSLKGFDCSLVDDSDIVDLGTRALMWRNIHRWEALFAYRDDHRYEVMAAPMHTMFRFDRGFPDPKDGLFGKKDPSRMTYNQVVELAVGRYQAAYDKIRELS